MNTFVALEDVNFSIPSGKCSLTNINAFISRVGQFGNTRYLHIVHKILSNTLYVPFSVFAFWLQECVKAFCKDIGNLPYYILYNKAKFGSEMWLLHFVYKNYLAATNCLGFFHEGIPYADNINLLYLDDCCYSGTQVNEIIDRTFVDESHKLNIFICIPYVTPTCLRRVGTWDINIKMYNIKIIQPVESFLNDNELQYIDHYLGIRRYAIPIYFDHKVGDKISSIRQLYVFGCILDKKDKIHFFGPLVKSLPSRAIVDDLKGVYKQFFMSTMQQLFSEYRPLAQDKL